MANLLDLPAEILLQILSYLSIPVSHPFWSQGITSKTLLPLSIGTDRKSRASELQYAKRLALVCRRLRPVFMSVVWEKFECKTAVGIKHLQNACAEEGGVGSYIQELDFQFPPLPLDKLETELTAIWPRLTSIHTLTLTLTPIHGCPAWLVTQVKSIPTLHTLHLKVMGNSLGPHLRAFDKLKELYIEISPPDVLDRQAEVLGEGPPAPEPEGSEGQVSREVYHSWTTLFNDFVKLVESCPSVTRMGWFVHWTMVHAFYRHMPDSPAEATDTNWKRLQLDRLPPNLTTLSVTLESQMGTEPFVRAMRSLPITDLALTSYNHALLSGTLFKDFCASFKQLRRLRLKLRSPSITVGNNLPEGSSINEEAFCEGLASLRHLKAYKGPLLCKRPSTRSSIPARNLRLEIKSVLGEITRVLGKKGVRPEVLVQWSAWVDGTYGPKEYYVVPHDGPRRVDEQERVGESFVGSGGVLLQGRTGENT